MKDIHENSGSDILRVEGVMSRGYGFSPQIVMRDKRLTPEAKCIYSYISSFAGAGVTAFPTVGLICEELNMSEKRYRKHFNFLKEHDYIRVKREKIPGNNLYGKNIYTLVQNPNKKYTTSDEKKKAAKANNVKSANVEKSDDVKMTATGETARYGQNDYIEENAEKPDTVKTTASIRSGRFRRIENDRNKSITFKRIDRKSINLSKKIYVNENIKRMDGQDGQKFKETLKRQLDMEQLVSEACQDKGKTKEKVVLLDYIYQAIVDMNNSERIVINGSIKGKAAITEAIRSLRKPHIQYIVTGIINNKKPIKNKKAYIQSCIFNSIFDLPVGEALNKIDSDKKTRQPKAEDKEELEQKQREQRRADIHEKIPKLKLLYEEIESKQRSLAKALFLKDDSCETLKTEIEELRSKKDLILRQHGYNVNYELLDKGQEVSHVQKYN